MSIKLLTKILFCRLNHFGYGEEKLWSNDGGNNPRNNKHHPCYAAAKQLGIRGAGGVKSRKTRTSIKYSYDKHNEADYNCNIAQDFKESTGAIERLKKFNHSFFAYKDTDYQAITATK